MHKKLTKKDWVTMVVTTALTLLPIIFGLAVYGRLPEEMPVHWNGAGEVDGYASKAMAVFGMPAFLALVNVACQFITLADPKHDNTEGKVRTLVFWLVPVISIVMNTVCLLVGLGEEISVERIAPLLVGIIFLIIGNYMPKVKQNYTIGIKVPWALNSEENWRRTHRLGGWMFMLCGVAMMLSAVISAEFFLGLMLGVLLAAAIVPMIYSYILYRKGI